MTIDALLEKIKDRFGASILKADKHSQKRLYLDIDPKDIVDIVRFVFKDLGLRFNIASAVDEFECMEILYHFSFDRTGLELSLRVALKDKINPVVDTITAVTRSAWWIEREMHELFGIRFNGNKDLRRLLLPDDWPDGVYPLRKNFVVPKRDSRKA